MTEQLAAFDVEQVVTLTDRQQAVLDALTAAGHAGLEPSEAGAVAHELKQGRWRHSRDDRCVYCGTDGLAILRRLRELGLARYRAGKLKVWQTVEITAEQTRTHPEHPDHDEPGPVPYNTFPANF